MKSHPKFLLRTVVLVACAACLISFAACKHSGGKVLEVAYVSGVQVNLRDRVAAVYAKSGLVKNGDRVEVLDHDRRFSKVRTSTGQMGWMEQRYLVSQQVFDQLQKLTADNANDPVQAQGVTRNDTNLHVADPPGLQQLALDAVVVVVEVGHTLAPEHAFDLQAEVVHQQPEVGGQRRLHVVADVVEFGLIGNPRLAVAEVGHAQGGQHIGEYSRSPTASSGPR